MNVKHVFVSFIEDMTLQDPACDTTHLVGQSGLAPRTDYLIRAMQVGAESFVSMEDRRGTSYRDVPAFILHLEVFFHSSYLHAY